jgi:hypothetical protein
MMTFTDLTSVPVDRLVRFTHQLHLAAVAYLARFTGPSRQHTESDLRCYLSWCAEGGPGTLTVRRPHLELYMRRSRACDEAMPECTIWFTYHLVHKEAQMRGLHVEAEGVTQPGGRVGAGRRC